jgi:uncharacterized membrane protein YhaH (DUF805 family)
MGMLRDGIDVVRRSGDYRGRARRTDLLAYWVVTLLGTVVLWLLVGLVGILAPGVPGGERVPLSIYQTIVCIPLVALWVRRLHDQGRTGLWLLLALPAIAVGIVRQYGLATWDFDLIFAPSFRAAELGAFLLGLPPIVLLFLDGEEGPNRYGPNPRYDTAEASA